MAEERELKFSLQEDVFPDAAELRAPLADAGFELGASRLLRYTDRYYDDARASLTRVGLALRRRLGEGEVIAALKSRGRVSGALHTREEIELAVEDNRWPDAIRRRISTVTDPGALRAHTEIETERLRYPALGDGRLLALLDFDRVSARYQGGERSVHFSELEIEAHGDTDSDTLEAIAAALEQLLPLTPNGATKLERAQALLLLGATLDD